MSERDDNRATQDRVSVEAHQRVVAERDQFKAEAEERGRMLADLAYRDKARSFFKEKGASEPDIAADLALPHLRGVEPDKVEELLSDSRFNLFYGQATPVQTPAPQVPTEGVTPPGTPPFSQVAVTAGRPSGVGQPLTIMEAQAQKMSQAEIKTGLADGSIVASQSTQRATQQWRNALGR